MAVRYIRGLLAIAKAGGWSIGVKLERCIIKMCESDSRIKISVAPLSGVNRTVGRNTVQ